MVGVTCGYRCLRQMSTRSRTWLTKSFFLILSAVNSAKSSSICWPRLRGRGTGMKYWLGRRPATISLVMPSSSNLKCCSGAR